MSVNNNSDRPLFHHDGSPAAEERLRSLAGDFQPGRVLAMFHAWPTPAFLAWFIIPGVVVAVYAALAAPDPMIAVVPLAIFWGIAVIFLVGGWLDRHRICEHALVLGARGKLVIPYETIDPGRIYDIEKGAVFLGRHIALSAGAVHGSTGPLFLLNGLQRDMLNLNMASATMPRTTSVFRYYTVGTRRQQEFLDALESAMVADGLGEAAGLSRSTFALRQVRLGRSRGGPAYFIEREILDPPLGVDARAPRSPQ